MQFDMFVSEQPKPALELVAHASSNYAPRTWENARSADVTVAFATDFTTHGEKLTEKAAGKKYIGIPYGTDPVEAADRLVAFMKRAAGRTLNVAGNGIYTLSKKGVTQAVANRWVHAVLKRVAANVAIDHIRSGGQTGIDTAGLVAGLALGIPVTGLYPKGFRTRDVYENDKNSTEDKMAAELQRQVEELLTQ